MNPVADAAVSILYPRRCPLCDRPVSPAGALICRECEGKAEYVSGACCMKCGKPLEDGRSEYCADCRVRPHAFDSGASVFIYHSVDRSVFRFKYEGRQEYAAWYGERTAVILGKKIKSWKPDLLVPVPIHPRRRKKRGYNQSELLAREIGERTGIPVSLCVSRVVDTKPQKGLGIAERQKNLEKAFKIRPGELKSKIIVVVDDIYTTGTTIDEMAVTARRAGAEGVFFITLATGNST
ncbi:MAG: ComF family protein [Lachnospiraceae bacterium]|nr:ComF family protein [Lachnospiraceae bacterium]